MSPRTTHVANGCNYPIWAVCIPDQRTSIELNAKLRNYLGVKLSQGPGNAASLSGLTKINSGDYLGFITDNSHFSGDLVYITIVYETNDQLLPICLGFSRQANDSVIVSAQYAVKNTKMGEIWVDRDGINHQP